MPSISSGNNSGLYDTNVTNIPIDDNIVANSITANTITTVTLTTTGNATVAGQLSVTGNITTAGNFIGNGAALTGMYGNANVANYMPVYGGNILSNTLSATGGVISTGNIQVVGTGGNITGADYVQGNYFVGDGSLLTNINAGNITNLYGNSNVAAFLAAFGSNVISTTGNTTSGNVRTSGQVSATGNVTGAFLFGNISQTTGGYGNANVVANLAALSTNPISTTGNVTAGYFIGNGSQLTGLPAVYSNANVATFLAAFGSNTISTSGNITSGNIIANGQFLTNLPAGNITGTVANATYALSANSATFAGTVTTNSQPNITAVGTLTSLTSTGTITGGNILTGGRVSATGNVTGNYIIGDGSLLTNINAGNIVGGYGNANVANFLANFGSNVITTTGNITGGNVISTGLISAGGNISGANLRISTAGNTWTITGDNIFSPTGGYWGSDVLNNDDYFSSGLDGYVDLQSLYANANVASAVHLEHGTAHISLYDGQTPVGPGTGTEWRFDLDGNLTIPGNITPDTANSFNLGTTANRFNQIWANGNISGGNILAAGQVSATGNITANYYFGNGSQLTGLPETYSNANVANYLPTYSGNIGAGNIIFTSNSGVAYVNNITGLSGQPVVIQSDGTEDINLNADTIRVGDNNADATIGTHGTGDLILRTHIGDASQGNITIRDGASGNIDIQTNGSGVVNITGTAGLRVADGISAVGNITGNYFFGNGSQLTGIVSSYGDSNVATFLANYGANTISSTGNITTTGIFTASNTTANLRVANLIVNNQQVQTVAARDPAAISNTVADPGRIVIGTGYGGNLSPGNDLNSIGRGSRLLVSDSTTQTDTQQRTVGIGVQQYYTAAANITNNNTRVLGLSSQMMVGGGASANTFGQTDPLSVNGGGTGLLIGGGTSGNLTAMGNTTVTCGTGASASVNVNPGSTARNGVGFVALHNGANGSGNIGNAVAYSWRTLASFGSGNTSCYTGNVYMVYLPGSASDFGWNMNAAARSAPNYYFLRNDDNAAQTKMGAMRTWHDFRYDHTTTTGNITIDKNNGQTQYLAVTGNITGITLSNFVTTASDGINTDQEMDTVTLWLRQDATGRTITMPTGANYFYESGTTTVPTTANSVSRIDFTAIDNSSTTQYLIKISAAYTST